MSGYLLNMGLWDFAWWVYQEVNFSPRITQITLIFFIFSREFAPFAVDFGSTMRNPKETSIFGGSSGRSLRGLRAGFLTVPACGSVRRPATARKEQDRFGTPRIIEKIHVRL